MGLDQYVYVYRDVPTVKQFVERLADEDGKLDLYRENENLADISGAVMDQWIGRKVWPLHNWVGDYAYDGQSHNGECFAIDSDVLLEAVEKVLEPTYSGPVGSYDDTFFFALKNNGFDVDSYEPSELRHMVEPLRELKRVLVEAKDNGAFPKVVYSSWW